MNKIITDEKYIPLDILENAGNHMGYVELLNAVREKTGWTHTRTANLIKSLSADRLIECSCQHDSTAWITNAGRSLLVSLRSEGEKIQKAVEEKQKAEERASAVRMDDRSERNQLQRQDHKFQILYDFGKFCLKLLLFLLLALLCLFLEHQFSVIDFLLSLF